MNYMEEAIKEAQIGIRNNEGGPFGSVVVKDDKIIGRGHNQVLENEDATCHGEIQAIRAASKALHSFDLSGCVLYTTAAPCPMCLGAIMWANIEKVYYGCTIDDTNAIGFRDEKFYDYLKSEDHHELPMIENQRDKCLDLFKEYSSLNPQKY